MFESSLKHGDTKGHSKTPEYSAWSHMLARCGNPESQGYHSYGGRGIRVCDEWRKSYEAFLADVGRRPSPKHSLDRYPNNDGNYEPGNVRWATVPEQRRNMRRNRFFTLDGRTMVLKDWAAEWGAHYPTVAKRARLWAAATSGKSQNS